MSAVVRLVQARRWGLKGPQAAQWLQQRKVPIPEHPNRWTVPDPEDDHSISVRLGTSEFLLEHGTSRWGHSRWPALAAELEEPIRGVYPVLREDCALLLEGTATSNVLLEVCSFDFAGLPVAEPTVVMTLMLGVAVIVVAQSISQPTYRIWCDPSYGTSLHAALQSIALETL